MINIASKGDGLFKHILLQIPQQETWYESRVIYASASIDDNTQAFYGLATSSLNKMGDMINMQPPL